jgi:hypothetical protein
VERRIVAWIREFLLARTQSVRVRRQLSEEVTVTSEVPQGPLLLVAYVNDIRNNTE